MSLDTFIPGIKEQTKLLHNGESQGQSELQLRRLPNDGFYRERNQYMLWLINEGELTLIAFCRQYADKITKEKYESFIKQIYTPGDFRRLAEEERKTFFAQEEGILLAGSGNVPAASAYAESVPLNRTL